MQMQTQMQTQTQTQTQMQTQMQMQMQTQTQTQMHTWPLRMGPAMAAGLRKLWHLASRLHIPCWGGCEERNSLFFLTHC
jgi:hypothetical protein